MRRVIVESPFKGKTRAEEARNIRYARACLRDCLLRGEAPYASHALYTLPGVLDDSVPEQRKLGMEAGWTWITVPDPELGIRVYTDLGVTSGMQGGIERAVSAGRDIEMRQLGGAWANGVGPISRICMDCGAPELESAGTLCHAYIKNGTHRWRLKAEVLEIALSRLRAQAHVHTANCYGAYEPCGEHHLHSDSCGGHPRYCPIPNNLALSLLIGELGEPR